MIIRTVRRRIITKGNFYILFRALFFIILITDANSCRAGIRAFVGDGETSAFILDDQGSVWAFHKADTDQEPYKLPGLDHIVSLAPYGAVRGDGKVLTWNLAQRPVQKCRFRPCELDTSIDGTYTYPEVVQNIDNGISISSKSYLLNGNVQRSFLVVLSDGRVAGWGDPIAWLSMDQAISPMVLPGLTDIKSVSVSGANAVALSRTGDVYAWGLPKGSDRFGAEFRDKRISSKENVALYTNHDAVQVATWGNYVIVLNNSGNSFYWGSCSSPLGEEVAESMLKRTKDSFSNIKEMYFSSSTLPIYIRVDGTVWEARPPFPADTYCAAQHQGPNGKEARVRQIPGMPIPADHMVGGLVIGSDGSLWEIQHSPVTGTTPKLVKLLDRFPF